MLLLQGYRSGKLWRRRELFAAVSEPQGLPQGAAYWVFWRKDGDRRGSLAEIASHQASEWDIGSYIEAALCKGKFPVALESLRPALAYPI